MNNKPYCQVYDKSGMVYYTDQNDRILTSIFDIDKLYSFIEMNYDDVDYKIFLDDNWDKICLEYWNAVITKLPILEYKANNTPNQLNSKMLVR